VVTASAGNHGLGLAFAARAYGLRCRVVIPAGAPRVKEAGIRALGAEVLRSPHDGYDATAAWALDHTGGARFVSPFEDAAVMAGNGGTLYAEIEEELPDLDAVVAPCGGGGLVNGIAVLARSRESGPRVIGVNTEASPGMWLSFRDGRAHLRVDSAPTIAEGIEGGVGEMTFRLARRLVERIVLVPEAALGPVVAEIARSDHMVVEGSAAAAVVAVLAGCVPAGSRVSVVLTGSNIDTDRLRALL
jgi:threonine dehydratase